MGKAKCERGLASARAEIPATQATGRDPPVPGWTLICESVRTRDDPGTGTLPDSSPQKLSSVRTDAAPTVPVPATYAHETIRYARRCTIDSLDAVTLGWASDSNDELGSIDDHQSSSIIIITINICKAARQTWQAIFMGIAFVVSLADP